MRPPGFCKSNPQWDLHYPPNIADWHPSRSDPQGSPNMSRAKIRQESAYTGRDGMVHSGQTYKEVQIQAYGWHPLEKFFIHRKETDWHSSRRDPHGSPNIICRRNFGQERIVHHPRGNPQGSSNTSHMQTSIRDKIVLHIVRRNVCISSICMHR